jgi:serine/threonine-protein kinase
VIGTVLGKYRVEAELSRGGMGAIYRARHEVIDRPVAVKLLKPELTEDPELVNRFINEAKAASAIRHPGIIDVLDFGYTDDGQAYLVMELLEGESLAQRVARKRRLDPSEAVKITRGIASALSAAHAKGIIHRDLKPDNVFIISDPDIGERPKVLDFGVAKLLDIAARTQHTQTGVLMGTPLYMAPEQARSAASIDERADLYSLGCILYELLVGEPPFPGQGAGEIIAAQMFTPPESPRARVESVSPELERVVLRLLEKEPTDRYATAAELAEVLAGLGTAPAAQAAPPAPATAANIAVASHSLLSGTTAQPRRKRDLLPWVVLAVIAVLGSAGFAAYYLSLGGPGGHKPADVEPPIARPEPVPVTPAPTPVVPVPVPAPPVVPVTQTPAPVEPERPTRPIRKQHPVTDKGSPIEPSLD